jgi:hypothetical protein
MQKRLRVNDDLAAEIAFAVDLRCCLCESHGELPPRARNGQIHHLDGDPSNRAVENLVWLCMEHHEDAGKVGKASRRLSPAVIRRYRQSLERHVQRRRAVADSKRHRERPAFYQALDAIVVVDIRKLRYRTGDDWDQVQTCLLEIGWYPDEIGFDARKEIFDYLYDLAGRARDRMPADVAASIRRAVLDLIPIRIMRASRRRRTTAEEFELMQSAIDIGMALAYDGALHLHNLKVVDSGCEILWRLLSYASIHRHKALRAKVLEAFDVALDGAVRSGDLLAAKLVHLAREYGERGGTRRLEYTMELATAL